MRNSLTAVAMIAVMLLSFGCVAQRQYDDLQRAYRKSQEQVVEMQSRLAALNQQIELLERGPQQDAARMAELVAERDQLLQQLGLLEDKFTSLADRDMVALPADVDQALKEFAANNSGLVEYDATRGMVKFRSDFTFGLGSTELTSAAESTLAQLSNLLTDGVASQYEIRVVGHTDSVPISRPATLAKHPSNWHLSVHRAIAVRDALQSGGVSPTRTAVAGYGMYRPIVQNTATGAEANRRVEIFLKSMTPTNQEFVRPGSGGAGSPSTRPANTGSAGGTGNAGSPQPQTTIPLK